MLIQKYIERGWKILPLHNPTPSGCSCGDKGCKSQAKHPRTSRGVKSASNDPLTIERWQTLWPNCNWGIATGAASGVVVLDIDAGKGGLESLAELEQQNKMLPPTIRVRTGSGGLHIYFLCPDGAIGNRAGILPGVDFRGDNGYVVAAGSLHANNNRYVLKTDGELAEMPDWLLTLVRGEQKTVTQPVAVKPGDFDGALAAMRKITMTDGNDGSRRLYSYACRAVEHNLSDEEAIRAIRIMELERPFP